MRLSIIIPMLNEAGNIRTTIESARTSTVTDLIVVDGGSKDEAVDVAKGLGAQVLITEAGRARQMNAGAGHAKGNVLLFVHADTRLPQGFESHICQILSRPKTIAGAFRLRIDSPRRSLRLIENCANWRSRVFQMPYGDQAIFVPTDVFRSLGGFAEIPIMEDFELMRRLHRLGSIAIAPVSVVTSARRWHGCGVWRTTLINQAAIIAYLVGVDPKTIARRYRHLSVLL